MWKEKKRRRTRRAARDAAMGRALSGGQNAHGANVVVSAHMADRKQQLQIALSLLPSFEFGKLSLPPSATPLNELPTFEQRQLDQMTGNIARTSSLSTSEKTGLELQRSSSKLGAAALSRAKSLGKSCKNLSVTSTKPKGEEELVLWCVSDLE